MTDVWIPPALEPYANALESAIVDGSSSSVTVNRIRTYLPNALAAKAGPAMADLVKCGFARVHTLAGSATKTYSKVPR